MAKLSSDDLMEAFKEMTLLELSEFVRDFEETFDVSAAVPAGEKPASGGDPEEPEEDLQTEFDVILTSAGNKKIQVIKEVRVLTSLGLKEAKDLVERAPATVLERAGEVDAANAKSALEAAGATVVLR
jgi:large subunit ribosomal protein L7/L12